MTYRRIPNPPPSSEADIDTPEMAESVAMVERDEGDLRMLSRLAEIAMELAEAQNDYARARLASAARGDAPLKPGEDPTGAFNKIAQTVRRIVALKGKLAQDVEKRRAGLVTERAGRRAQRAEAREKTITGQIDCALTDAFTEMYGDGDEETDEGDALCREMLSDKEDLLDDLEAFSDYLDRPIGETVAKLCVALGLPADTCVKEGGAWLVRRPPSAYQIFRETRAAGLKRAPALASSP